MDAFCQGKQPRNVEIKMNFDEFVYFYEKKKFHTKIRIFTRGGKILYFRKNILYVIEKLFIS